MTRLVTGNVDARASSSTAMQLIDDLIVVSGIAVAAAAVSVVPRGGLVNEHDEHLTRGRD